MLSGKIQNEFPWGGDFPPKTKDSAGNFADTAWKEKFPAMSFLEGYTDGFPTTAPVMSFKPNKLGLYDLGGNVQEWVGDWLNAAQKARALRGSSWHHQERSLLLSSGRMPYASDYRSIAIGFRIVVELTAP